jgi:hypothetical protein
MAGRWHGHPQTPGPERPRRLGVARGQFTVPESIDAANPLIAELFEQA